MSAPIYYMAADWGRYLYISYISSLIILIFGLSNEIFAKEIGINPSASVTCIKPSGTVSQLVDSSSGIHPRHARYYIRRVRNDKKDPLSQKLIDSGIEYLEDPYNKDAWVFEFPMKATGSKTRHDVSAMEQLELW